MLGFITYLTGRLVNSIKSSLPRPHPVGADNTTHHSRKADSLPFTAFGIIWKWQMQQCYNWASNFFNSSSSPNSFINKLFLVPQFYLRRRRGRFLWNAKPLKKGEKKWRRGKEQKYFCGLTDVMVFRRKIERRGRWTMYYLSLARGADTWVYGHSSCHRNRWFSWALESSAIFDTGNSLVLHA